jgi:glutamate-ammonia-ligase adenylyltransferase
MDQAHPNRSGLFDLKHGRGGMIDIEFVVQYLVLAQASAHVGLRANSGNIALLHESARIGLIDPTIAAAAADAYRSLRRRQHTVRLNGAEFARVPFETVAEEATAGRALWAAVLGKR